jgi:hypothetical protein
VQDGRNAAVLDGLQEGELVILHPAGMLVDKKVRAEISSTAAGEKE